ncbi:LysE family transporter [Streptomyces sp. NPDC052701]|uniref:LysE family translocator n=1 Tax=Streptomyces sp. NPDC052701 TaxID=3155533 RepID=UPI00343F2E28
MTGRIRRCSRGPGVSSGRLLASAAASLALIPVPGPSAPSVVGRAPAQGRRAAPTAVAGNTLGACVLVVAVASGTGSAAERSVPVLTAPGPAGTACPVYLGARTRRERGAPRAAFAGGGAAHGGTRTFREGFAVGAGTPGTLVFFAAVLPQPVARGQGGAARGCPCRTPVRAAGIRRTGSTARIPHRISRASWCGT